MASNMCKEYNYFEDVNPHYKKTDFDWKNRIDPESESSRLYENIWKLFFFDEEQNKKLYLSKFILKGQKGKDKQTGRNYIYYTLFVNDEQFLLSSDYIGPSINYFEAEYKKKIIEESRLLGGHIVWPRNVSRDDNEKRWIKIYYDNKKKYYTKYLSLNEIDEFKKNKEREDNLDNGKWCEIKLTINTQRGGEYGVYDRIDCTLKLLKIYYDLMNININKKPQMDTFIYKCRCLYEHSEFDWKEEMRIKNMFYAIDNSYEWLRKFNKFKYFCDFFKLVNSFVDEEYNVYSFNGKLFPIEKPNENYMTNNINAVKERNNIIFDR